MKMQMQIKIKIQRNTKYKGMWQCWWLVTLALSVWQSEKYKYKYIQIQLKMKKYKKWAQVTLLMVGDSGSECLAIWKIQIQTQIQTNTNKDIRNISAGDTADGWWHGLRVSGDLTADPARALLLSYPPSTTALLLLLSTVGKCTF